MYKNYYHTLPPIRHANRKFRLNDIPGRSLPRSDMARLSRYQPRGISDNESKFNFLNHANTI